MVSHIEASIPDKPITLDNIFEAIKVPHKQIRKEALFVKYDKNKCSTFFRLTYQSNTSLMEQRSSVHSFLQVSRNATILHVEESLTGSQGGERILQGYQSGGGIVEDSYHHP